MQNLGARGDSHHRLKIYLGGTSGSVLYRCSEIESRPGLGFEALEEEEPEEFDDSLERPVAKPWPVWSRDEMLALIDRLALERNTLVELGASGKIEFRHIFELLVVLRDREIDRIGYLNSGD